MIIAYKRENASGSIKHSKRVWLSICLFALIASGQTGYAANEPTLVLNDPTDAPYTTLEGDGFFDVIVKETFRRVGLRLKLVRLPAERGLMNANAGIEDGDLSRIAGLEKTYPNLVRVPEKIFDMDFVAFSRKATPTEASWVMLEPVLVGHIKGWKIFENNLRPGTHVTLADNPQQLFSLLEKDRVDVALYDRWMGTALAKKTGIRNVHVVEPPLATREMFIYLHQRHADKIPAIAATLRALKVEGLYTQVCREKFAALASSFTQCEFKK